MSCLELDSHWLVGAASPVVGQQRPHAKQISVKKLVNDSEFSFRIKTAKNIENTNDNTASLLFGTTISLGNPRSGRVVLLGHGGANK